MSKRVLILAPHIDDELIGCSQILLNPGNEVTVGWFEEITKERRLEGLEAAAVLGFTPVFGFDQENLEQPWSYWDEVLVPRRDDAHPAHKRVSAKYREYATSFYSVDMVSAPVLAPSSQERKRELLNRLYPSQSVLWERDHKYWLFENVWSRDYNIYSVIHHKTLTVTCLVEFSDAVKKVIAANEVSMFALSDVAINKVLAVCPVGKVTFEIPELGLKVEA